MARKVVSGGAATQAAPTITQEETVTIYEVTVSYIGDKWQWRVEGVLKLFELLDGLQLAFAPAEINVRLAA